MKFLVVSWACVAVAAVYCSANLYSPQYLSYYYPKLWPYRSTDGAFESSAARQHYPNYGMTAGNRVPSSTYSQPYKQSAYVSPPTGNRASPAYERPGRPSGVTPYKTPVIPIRSRLPQTLPIFNWYTPQQVAPSSHQPTYVKPETQGDDACPGCCENAFNTHTSNSYEVKCIVYDDANCNSKDWVLTFGDRSKQTLTGRYKNNTESVSIRKGCKLSLFTGENYTGRSVVLPAAQEDWHGTLDTNPDKNIQTFDDAVNSITCDCN